MFERPPLDLWDAVAPLTPLAGGHRNVALRTQGLAHDLVFKTTRRDEDAIAWLGPVLTLAARSGLIVPHPIRSKNGRYIEHGWTCEPFISGEPFRQGDMNRLASPLLHFQTATMGIQQRPGFLSAHDLLQRDRGGDIDLSLMPADIAALCRAAWRRIKPHPVCAVHGDLTPGNLFVTENNGIALLDWDECRADTGAFDSYQIDPGNAGLAIKQAVIAWEVACSWHLEPQYATILAEKFSHMMAAGT